MSNLHYTTRALINRRKRQQQLKHHIITLLISIVIVLFASVLLISFSTHANDLEHQPSYKYYKSIEISNGDTLWSIARENMDYEHYQSTSEYINEVKRMNSLTSDKIISGNCIIIPYYSTEFISY